MARYRPSFKKVLLKYFPESAKLLISEIERSYDIYSQDVDFAKRSANPVDRRLDFCAYFLGTIKVLESKGVDFDTIRKVSLEITVDYVQPKNGFQGMIKKLPAILIGSSIVKPLLKRFASRVSMKGNENRFRAEIITDKAETFGLGYGVNIHECGICKLFALHDAHKYASILCEVDEVTSSLAGLKLIRTGTIANGAKVCDFRWRKL